MQFKSPLGIAFGLVLGAAALLTATEWMVATQKEEKSYTFDTPQKLPQCNKFPIEANYCIGDDLPDVKGPLMVCTETCERRYLCHTDTGRVYGVSIECEVHDAS